MRAEAFFDGRRWVIRTTSIGRDLVAVAFWARVGAVGPVSPHPCTHQVDATVVPAESRWTKWW
ncbi:hypothetical protein NQK81_35295 [Amycolatopsis roodepoortensis]|uniref:hypothetical protein n=1 Tax=Amycolatopsis roodepoortensis TaxID=700274 RepID=UPI00214C0DBA|nr:hypothetical protein [Amycolatopsis roodepoortensis]UUV29989.1 hypothetical protein NQK81_35295 [Amycolatopsis roodepoortensis]